MTLQHKWVKHTITNVDVLPNPDNDAEVVVIEDPSEIEAAELGAVYGCDVCGISMEGNTDTTCDPMCYCGVNLSEHNSITDHDHRTAR